MGSDTFGFDSRNRLTSSSGVGGARGGDVSYDPAGRLYAEDRNGPHGVTRFVYAGDRVIAEEHQWGGTLRRYVPGAGADETLVWFEHQQWNVYDRQFLLTDPRGSVVAVTDDAGAAITAILAGKNRLIGVQGYAGTGKTTMMRQTAALAKDLAPAARKEGYQILGLAPTHSARATLEENGKFESKTVQRFLIDARKGEVPKDMGSKIVLIDESSFLSTKSMNLILRQLIDLKPARIVLSGDRRQHGAVEAGRPFDIAQKSGMTTAVMKDIVRLPKDDAHADQRAAMEAAGEGKVLIAMKRLAANMRENKEPEKAAVAAWSSLPRARQANALIVAPGHRLRTAINFGVRKEMMRDGRLSAETAKLPVWQAKDLTRAETTSPRSYQKGDLLIFHARLDALNAKKHSVREVVHVDEERGLITIRNTRGREQTLKADQLAGRFDSAPFSLNREEELDVRRGDTLLFTRSDADKEIAALDQTKVLGFDETTVTLEMRGGAKTFERSDPALRSLSHGYAITSHAAQGKTADDVISVMDSKDRALTSQTGFYVSISRSADTMALIVDDKSRVMNALLRNSGIKSSALDTKARIEALTGLDKDPVDAGDDRGMGDTDAAPDKPGIEPLTGEPERSGSDDKAPGMDDDMPLDRDMEM